jgi:hypothetical protein
MQLGIPIFSETSMLEEDKHIRSEHTEQVTQ